jgi:hypothetical protein
MILSDDSTKETVQRYRREYDRLAKRFQEIYTAQDRN